MTEFWRRHDHPFLFSCLRLVGVLLLALPLLAQTTAPHPATEEEKAAIFRDFASIRESSDADKIVASIDPPDREFATALVQVEETAMQIMKNLHESDDRFDAATLARFKQTVRPRSTTRAATGPATTSAPAAFPPGAEMTIVGDQATLRNTSTDPTGRTHTTTLHMVRRDGRWKFSAEDLKPILTASEGPNRMFSCFIEVQNEMVPEIEAGKFASIEEVSRARMNRVMALSNKRKAEEIAKPHAASYDFSESNEIDWPKGLASDTWKSPPERNYDLTLTLPGLKKVTFAATHLEMVRAPGTSTLRSFKLELRNPLTPAEVKTLGENLGLDAALRDKLARWQPPDPPDRVVQLEQTLRDQSVLTLRIWKALGADPRYNISLRNTWTAAIPTTFPGTQRSLP